ncbi:MAG TPA: PTS sugar transporter subunit IIB [Pseudoclavibacter sp.]|nr:PTS sugar transporter subunit IIB [Pseudoclavibacter sp.]
MIKVITVCGNGIGSSLMLKMKIEEIARENGIDADVESIDSGAALGKKADLFVTVKEFADVIPPEEKVVFVRSYINKKKIQEDVLETLKDVASQAGK